MGVCERLHTTCRLCDPTRRSDPRPRTTSHHSSTREPHIHMRHVQVLNWKVQDEVSVQLHLSESLSERESSRPPRRPAQGRWVVLNTSTPPPFFYFASTSHRAWIAHEVATFPISRGSSRARLWFPRSPRGQSQAGPAEVTPRGGRHEGSTNVFCLSPPGAGEAGRRDNWALLEISVSPQRCLVSRALITRRPGTGLVRAELPVGPPLPYAISRRLIGSLRAESSGGNVPLLKSPAQTCVY